MCGWCGCSLNSYRVQPSGASIDTVGTSCLPSVAMRANRALSSVYPLRGKQVDNEKSDGLLQKQMRSIYWTLSYSRIANVRSMRKREAGFRGIRHRDAMLRSIQMCRMVIPKFPCHPCLKITLRGAVVSRRFFFWGGERRAAGLSALPAAPSRVRGWPNWSVGSSRGCR